jgi:hypothetical protein
MSSDGAIGLWPPTRLARVGRGGVNASKRLPPLERCALSGVGTTTTMIDK